MLTLAVVMIEARTSTADEIWVVPTFQQDTGGGGTAAGVLWPVTKAGAVRLAWAVPNDLDTFDSAKIAIIPQSPGGASTLNVFICPAQNGELVYGACAGPFAQTFTGVPDQLVEVDISALLAPRVGTPGVTYLSVVGYTSPNTATDHFVGLRFSYSPK
jgi:hypothetical protein